MVVTEDQFSDMIAAENLLEGIERLAAGIWQPRSRRAVGRVNGAGHEDVGIALAARCCTVLPAGRAASQAVQGVTPAGAVIPSTSRSDSRASHTARSRRAGVLIAPPAMRRRVSSSCLLTPCALQRDSRPSMYFASVRIASNVIEPSGPRLGLRASRSAILCSFWPSQST